jgi:hypothetical protein
VSAQVASARKSSATFELSLLRRVRHLVAATAATAGPRLRQPDDVLGETIRENGLIDPLGHQAHDQQNEADNDEFGRQAGSERTAKALALRLVEHESDFAWTVRFRAYSQMRGLKFRPLILFALGRRH